MRRALLLAALLLGACEPFYEVQQEDSIEAYEAYIEAHPDSRFRLQATTRLEELYLERAKEGGTLEAYDAYLDRFPDGVYRDKAMKEREDSLYEFARKQDTVAAWEKYLAEYPKADKKKRDARRAIAMAKYRPHLAISEVRSERTNLAEDPEGPLDGWKLAADVTNEGEQTLSYLKLAVRWEGAPRAREWPLVAEDWPIPMPDEAKRPVKPGETRTWVFTTQDIPADYAGALTIKPTAVAFVGSD